MQTTTTTKNTNYAKHSTQLNFEEVSAALALFGLEVQDRGQGIYDVRGKSSVNRDRSIIRLAHVSFRVLQQLASETGRHTPTKNHNGQVKIQTAIIHAVMKGVRKEGA